MVKEQKFSTSDPVNGSLDNREETEYTNTKGGGAWRSTRVTGDLKNTANQKRQQRKSLGHLSQFP